MFGKNSKTIGRSEEETRQYHKQYLEAVNNPHRRKILEELKNDPENFEDLQKKTGLNAQTLKWHLNILERGFCIEKYSIKGKLLYKLTQEGKIIDYL